MASLGSQAGSKILQQGGVWGGGGGSRAGVPSAGSKIAVYDGSQLRSRGWPVCLLSCGPDWRMTSGCVDWISWAICPGTYSPLT